MSWGTVATGFAVVAGAGSLVAVATYWRTTWWRTAIGRHVMLCLAALAGFAVMRGLRAVAGSTYPGREVLSAAGWAVAAWAAVGTVVLILRAQRAGRHTQRRR